MIASLSCKIPSDRLSTSFTEQFLTSSKFKLVMGSGRGIISTPQAQILLAYFRGIPVETVLSDEPAVHLLQGKSTRLLRDFLINAESDTYIQQILAGESSQSSMDEQPRVLPIDNAKRESDSISWAEDDDDDGDDDYALVTWGYMSFSDGGDDSGDFSTDDDFNEDCVFSIPSSVGMLTPRLSSSHSATSVSMSPASRPGSRPRSRPGLSPASHSTPTSLKGMTLHLPPDPTRFQKMLVGRKPMSEELSQTSVLLYTPNGTPPPPDCNIVPELFIHAAMNTPRS